MSRKKNTEITKDLTKTIAAELVKTLMAALSECGVTLDLEQQLHVLTKLKTAIDAPAGGGGDG